MRADWRLDGEERRALRARGRRTLEGTPFERILAERRVEVRLAEGGRHAVTLELRQRGRGWARFGGLHVAARGAASELDEALDGLGSACCA